MSWQQIKTQALTGWNFFRVVRLLFSVVVVIQAIMSLSIPLGILGALLLMQVFISPGCAAGGCGIPSNRDATPPRGNAGGINYEEIKK